MRAWGRDGVGPAAPEAPGVFKHEWQGRHAGYILFTIVAAAIAIGVGVWTVREELPAMMALLPIPFVLWPALIMVRNPRAGMRLDRESISFHAPKGGFGCPLSEIDRVEFVDRGRSGMDYALHRTNGLRYTIDDWSLPMPWTFRRELEAKGVRVVERRASDGMPD